MVGVESCSTLCQRIVRSCGSYVETLALLGAWYTARRCLDLLWASYSLIRVHFTSRLLRRIDLVKQYGSWAVVTGASDGIGKCYAEELARRGLNVVLIARNKEKLESVSQAIADRYHVETAVIVADFSKGREVYPSLKQALSGIEIGILVNNAGVFYDYPEYFTLVPEEKLWEVINVNVVAATMLMHMVLPGMVGRKKGAIVTVASAACYRQLPLMSQYAASKAYLDLLSRSVQHEYSSSGVFFQSLTPFSVTTKMTAFSARLQRGSWLVPSAVEFCRHAMSTLGISTRTTGYWSHHLQWLLQMFLPERLWVSLISLINHSLREEALGRISPQRNLGQ